MRVRMVPAARGELAEVVARYEDEKEDLGEEFLDEFAKVIDRTRAWPLAARKVSRGVEAISSGSFSVRGRVPGRR